MKNRLFTILLFAFGGLTLSDSHAKNTDCNPIGFLRQTTSSNIREDLMKGYHLPSSYLNSYYARRVEPFLAKPHYAEVVKPQSFYRGMYITLDELENILKNGMKKDLVRWNSAGGGISFSSNVNEAATYIFQSGSEAKKGIGVVFKVKASPEMILADDPILNSTRTIFKKHSDVQAGEIEDVYIWGEYGLESLSEVSKKSLNGKIKPHETWTGIFDQGFSR